MKTMLKIGVAVAMATLLTGVCAAQTLVSGDISGTWWPAGNPYVVTNDATVPYGTNLTIEAGTIVQMGSNVTLTANGVIQALGTPAQRISFKTADSSQFYYTLSVYGGGGTNQFKYCDFQNAAAAALIFNGGINEVLFCRFQNVNRGIGMSAVGTWQRTTILNCSFTNCSSSVGGTAVSFVIPNPRGWPQPRPGTITAFIKNCVFHGGGCSFSSIPFDRPYPPYSSYSYLQMANNVFCYLTNDAIRLYSTNAPYGGGSATLINNTFVNAGTGVNLQGTGRWNATVQDCIFAGCTNATVRTAYSSLDVEYNDYFNNATNFSGSDPTCGQIVATNRNGTPCDVYSNIFQNPLFVAANDFHLQTNSPCIDAGTPDWAYTDMCFTDGASQGSSYPDLGAYGGPDAANWLENVPILPVLACMAQTNQVVYLNWGAIPRSSYKVQVADNLQANYWTDFPDGSITASNKPTSIVVSTNAVGTNQQFFRVQSLGRMPGN